MLLMNTHVPALHMGHIHHVSRRIHISRRLVSALLSVPSRKLGLIRGLTAMVHLRRQRSRDKVCAVSSRRMRLLAFCTDTPATRRQFVWFHIPAVYYANVLKLDVQMVQHSVWLRRCSNGTDTLRGQ